MMEIDKVFRKMGFLLSKNDIVWVVNAQPLAIERILKVLKVKFEKMLENQELRPKPESETTDNTAQQQARIPIERPPEKQTSNQETIPRQKPKGNKNSLKIRESQPTANQNGTQDSINLPVPPVYYPNSSQKKE